MRVNFKKLIKAKKAMIEFVVEISVKTWALHTNNMGNS